MWECASALGLTPHEARIGEGFMRAGPQSTGTIPRGTRLTWNGSNALVRGSAPRVAIAQRQGTSLSQAESSG
jgi:hypothetical protein